MAKYCTSCGAAQQSDESKFCYQCGSALADKKDLNLDFRGNVSNATVMAAGRDVVTHIDGEMVECRVCGGSGEMERISTCPDCQGKGITRYQKPVRRGSRYLTAIGCPTCGGYGEETQRRDRSARQSHLRPGSGQLVEIAQCEACGGQGKVRI